ncbi:MULTISPECIES: hypothetical protein [unclassified Moorena]|uniref:hypothetical protein n=1 Tax=unclassified Moorena TaxID=2683338 RepID=UPI0013FE8393|nr:MULTISPECIES: hypothetical protein [unclassified Moorena]NEO15430.1 hypothetical protein [Moorena sp. SIO3E8]NEQ02538.1 hypothetical protein [Moorena sp. SIO3F7]
MPGGQGKSSFLDAIASGGNPQDRAASLKTQSLAYGHATRTTTNRCVNPARHNLRK